MITVFFMSLLFASNPSHAEWDAKQLEVIQAIQGYLSAWNSFDAQALADYCHIECDRIDARGNTYEGKDEILQAYTRAFSKPPPPGIERRLTYEILNVRFPTDKVAIVDAKYTLYSPPPIPDGKIEGMNTVVLVRIDGRWLRYAHRQRIPVSVDSVRKQQQKATR